MMEISAACASTSVGMAVTNMCAELICRFGTEAQKKRYVTRLVSGEAVAGAFALSEPHAGSDAGGARTTAVKKGERWVLNGTKQWITSGELRRGDRRVGPHLGRAATKGLSCFIVEGGTPGLHVGKPEDKMGLRGSNTVPLTFEDCAVGRTNLLGQEGDGFKLAMIALDGGRIGIASQACGVGRAALEAAVTYAKDRAAFGHPIGDFQAIRFMLADMATEPATRPSCSPCAPRR